MISVFKKILALNLFFININSADLPEHEKKKVNEWAQKAHDDRIKFVIRNFSIVDTETIDTLYYDLLARIYDLESQQSSDQSEHEKKKLKAYATIIWQKNLAVLDQKEFTPTEWNVAGAILKI